MDELIDDLQNSSFFIGLALIALIFAVVWGGLKVFSSGMGSNLSLIKDGVTMDVCITGTSDRPFFDVTDYGNDYAFFVQEAINAYPLEVVLEKRTDIIAYADSAFYQKTGIKASVCIDISLNENVQKALAAKKIAELDFQSLQYQLAKDSLISAKAKKDSEGYTPAAERLENRRDQRLNSAKNRESNEQIENRKAEALEEAASNVGFLSGDLTIVQK